MSGLVIIGCGKDKLAGRARAEVMYTGSLFRLALQAALALTDRENVRILSAKYGLLRLDDEIDSYDLTIGQEGAVTASQLARQAEGTEGARVTALCSKRYAALIKAVWSEVDTPLAGLGIGYQRQALAQLRDHRTEA